MEKLFYLFLGSGTVLFLKNTTNYPYSQSIIILSFTAGMVAKPQPEAGRHPFPKYIHYVGNILIQDTVRYNRHTIYLSFCMVLSTIGLEKRSSLFLPC